MQNDILGLKNIKNLKVLAISALFAAFSIILGKFLAFNIGVTLRFSLENLPIILSGFFFGGPVGALTALVADIIGLELKDENVVYGKIIDVITVIKEEKILFIKSTEPKEGLLWHL